MWMSLRLVWAQECIKVATKKSQQFKWGPGFLEKDVQAFKVRKHVAETSDGFTIHPKKCRNLVTLRLLGGIWQVRPKLLKIWDDSKVYSIYVSGISRCTCVNPKYDITSAYLVRNFYFRHYSIITESKFPKFSSNCVVFPVRCAQVYWCSATLCWYLLE